MTKWEQTNFRPKWARTPEDRELFSNMPDVGHVVEPVPSVATRIVPVGGGSCISAATLSDAVLLKQRIMNYASYEVVRGIDPSFSDLRKIDEQCLQLGRLDFEPFDEGSFVIPAELRSDPLSIQTDGRTYMISAVDVVERFNHVLRELPQKGIDLPVSIGLLSEINELNKLLKREVASLEFVTVLPPDTERGLSRRSARHASSNEYLARIDSIRKTRQHIEKRSGNSLKGTLVAVDCERRKIKIRLDSEGNATVPGTFLPPLEKDLVANLMKKAEFIGQVKYQLGAPKHIKLVKLVPLSSV